MKGNITINIQRYGVSRHQCVTWRRFVVPSKGGFFIYSWSPRTDALFFGDCVLLFFQASGNMNAPPVDLSFRNIENLRDSCSEEPSNVPRSLKKDSRRKFLSCSLRLNNNNISDLYALQNTIDHFLAEPLKIAWLDLSFNKIRTIHRVLCELSELRVLNLHGNAISILSEVERLGVLPHLHTITLHGNAIEGHRGYRSHVISALPHLKKMDFSAVTPDERMMANIWRQRRRRVISNRTFP
ncbi:leucine-rich repeat-containing protein 51 [Neosynchiropus ocellatus]